MPFELLITYCRSVYEVAFDGRWHDCSAPGVATRLLVNRGFAEATDPVRLCVLSACNPQSQPLPSRENRERHQSLCAALRAHHIPCWPARGRAADGHWVEASVLLCAPLTRVDELARRYGQHAVWCPGETPALRIYSDPLPGLPDVMADVRLEWVGCGPPAPADAR